MIREAKSLLLGEYGKLFEENSFKSILLEKRGDHETVCGEWPSAFTRSRPLLRH